MTALYFPLLVALIIAAAVAAAMVIGALLLGPKRPTRFKLQTYECGMTPVGSARERFPVRFYVVAMLFIIFDIETVFLYPWAATFGAGSRPQKLFLLGEMGVFVVILLIAYFYAVGSRALEWTADDGPERQPQAADGALSKRRQPIRFGNEDSGAVQIPVQEQSPS